MARGKFMEMPLEGQCKCLYQILQLFRKSGIADLRLLDESSLAGKILFSRTLSENTRLIHTSVTGFYRQEINLLKV